MNGLGGFMAGSIIAKLLLDKTGWNESVKSVGKDTEVLGAKATALGMKMEALGKRMSSVGRSMTRALTLPLAAIGGASIKMAMDAAESENLFEVSMGNMAKAARDWSVEMSKSLGLNQYETRKTIGTFNVMMKSMGQGEKSAYGMAKGLTQLGYDMASFYNLKPEEAFLKLQAAISGEVEPLKRLGVIVNETTIKQWALTNGLIRQGEQLTETQKVTARFNVIMEQTSLAQGDLARTIDSPANKLRLLKSRLQETSVELGTRLLPMFLKVVDSAKGVVTWFSGLSDSTQALIVKVGLFSAAAGPAMTIIGRLLIIIPRLTAAVVASTAAWSAATAAVGYYIIKLIELGDAKAALRAAEANDIAYAERLNNQLRAAATLTFKMGEATSDFVTDAKMDEIIASYGEFSAAALLAAQRAILMGQHGPVLAAAMAKIREEFRQAAEKARVAAISGTELDGVLDGLTTRTGPLIEQFGTMAARVDDAREAFSRLADENLGALADALNVDELAADVGILDGVIADGVALVGAASDEAGKQLTSLQQIANQVTADIITGFGAIMDGSKTMAEGVVASIQQVIAALGKLVIANIIAAKTSIKGSMFQSIARHISNIFRAVPFPLDIILAAGAFGAVSKLFSKLLKFKEGGVFKEPTIAEVGHGTEYVLPEKKLINIVRDAILPPMMPAPVMAGGGGGMMGGATVSVHFTGPLIQTTGLSRRDLEAAGEDLRHIVDRQMRRVGRRQ